ncbi:adenosine deaminase [Lachnospiraceae bacterium]|nr:adenosine deaminase [Lachnospiraceae bacterium]
MGYTDLHLHLDGSLSSEAVKFLAWMDEVAEIDLPYEDSDLWSLLSVGSVSASGYGNGIRNISEKRSLNEYLKKFDLPLSLLQTEENLSYAVMDIAKNLKKLDVDYAEIRFAPQLHTARGLTQLKAVEAVLEGYQRRLDFSGDDRDSLLTKKMMTYENMTGVDMGLDRRPEYPHIRFILCLMRGSAKDQRLYEMNMETVEVARHLMSEGNSLIAGLDLAGAEGLYPTDEYRDFFGLARKYHIPFTIHAGEAAGPESVWEALEMGATRIGHGIAAQEDEYLMQELAKRHTVIEMCPTSNLQTGAVQDMSKYPLRLFLLHDMKVTVNSDNMTVSDTNVVREFEFLKETTGISDEEKRILRRNAEEGHL